LNIDILGMSEIKWKDVDFWSESYRVIYAADKNKMKRWGHKCI
jgi:hypothetical protein